ncbi:hypothetical protein EJ02DRAFT_457048 [Clathrospora elynae]|uniref:Uncharacterized protein n=1 Tax=Clathrospora elynae TaxID=706981 RepID=A0A6A5SL72_9PLEO|nr:hypothetical protein EJ02DRAFT_457048 [Clathrospora elynae]
MEHTNTNIGEWDKYVLLGLLLIYPTTPLYALLARQDRLSKQQRHLLHAHRHRRQPVPIALY